MKSRLRELKPKVSYHVGGKINRDEFIFDNEIVVNLLLDVIERCKKKFEFSIIIYSIMGNHVHYILYPEGDTSLPKIMQWINSVFAKAYNKLTGQSGHVWKERYFSVIIETVEQFINTFEYIVKNPLAAKLVKHARDYQYCGLYHYQHDIKGIIDLREPFIQDLYERCLSL